VREHEWFECYTHSGSVLRFCLTLLTLLLLGAAARPQSSGTVLLGSQNIASSRDSDSPGEAEAFQFAASASGTLGTLSVYVDSSNSSTQLVVGLYSSSGQNPGTLLTQGSISSPVAGAWNAVVVPPVSVTAGTVYWIAILGTGGTLDFRDTGSSCISEASAQSNMTTLPSAWSVGSRWYTCTLSAYGSTSSAAPVLAVSQSSASFSATQGSGTNPSPVSVNVSNTGGGTLTFSTSSDSSWLSVTPSSGTAPQTMQVSAALGTLAAGTYTGHITVTATGAQNSPSTITATFVVSAAPPAPALSVSPTTLTFSATQGGGNPAASSVNVTNSGGGSLSFAASSDSSWLSVSPTSGSAPEALQISATLGALSPGTYTGHITITAAGVQGSPAIVTVNFTVAPDAAPVISSVAAAAITSSGATITWTTNKPATSQVNYGATTAYGSSSPENSTLVTSHSVTLSALTASTLYHYQVQSADSVGTLAGSPDATFTTLAASGGSGSSCPCSIWSSTASPTNPSVNDGSAVELGVKFTSSASGYITGVRFYKGSRNTGTHTGSLWTNSGTLLAAATFTTESSSGWQQVNFATPVAIAANTTYVASYHTTVGYYAGDTQYFANSGTNAPPLQALSNQTAHGNGVYVYGAGSVFPSSTYESTNYWVDVVFVTSAGSSGSPTIYGISGTISGGAGATVTLSGASSASTTANASGNFSFSNLASGSYAVTPTESGYTFSPASQNITVNNANVTGVNFTATAQTFSISGTISGGSGSTVTLTGASSASTTSDRFGNFSFTGLSNGSYTVTPSKSGYTFTPASQNVTVNSASVTGVNFTAAAQTFSISGTISGTGSETVTLSGASSASTTADASGNFSFSSLANGSYAVTPSKTGYTFAPTSQAVTINGSNVTGVTFTASAAAPTYSISGSLSPASVGSGATVTLSGAAAASTTADANGNFSFSSLNNGTYTITPSSTSATFSPTSQNVTISSASVTGVSFTATATANVIFYDDFTGTTLGSAWVAMNRAGDYSNSEQECYNPSQVSVSNSNLVITTVAQTSTCGDSDHSPGQFPFLSGMVQWQTFNFTYGTVEFRAKTAGGRGSWPAVWLLGADCQASNINSADNVGSCNWPNPGSDEIDILEMSDNNYISVGHDMFVSSGGQACFQNASSDTSQNWHVYTMTWKAGSVTYAIDGTPAGCSHTQNVPTTPMFLIINNAIASAGASASWPVVPSDFPQTMEVDYVKITQP
jgi:hypothetical protein